MKNDNTEQINNQTLQTNSSQTTSTSRKQSDVDVKILIGSFLVAVLIIPLLSYLFPKEYLFPLSIIILILPIILFSKVNIIGAIKNFLYFFFFIIILPIILFFIIIRVAGVPSTPEYIFGYILQTFYYTGLIPIILGIIGYTYFMKRFTKK